MSTPLPQVEKKYTTPEEVQALIDQAMRNFRYPTKVAGGFLQSQNFLSGQAGWRLSPDGTIEGWKLIQGGTTISISANDSIQTAIDALPAVGGTVILGAGTFNVTSHITLPSNVQVVGQGGGTVVDFGGNSAQFQIVGTLVYNTGTVSINTDSTTVTGVGTTFTSAMVGEYILISEFWYEITGFTNSTTITIGSPFSSSNASGATFVIATIKSGSGLSNFVIQNSAIFGVKFQYHDSCVADSLVIDDCLGGLDDDDSSGLTFNACFVTNCGTGATMNNTQFCTVFNSSLINITSGGGFVINNMANAAFIANGLANIVGTGISLTSVTNTAIENWSVRDVTGVGINLVSGNQDCAFTDGSVRNCSSDGFRFTATSDQNYITNTTIFNNSGWGVNIAAATCDNNIIHGNAFSTNTSGNITDSGTLTIRVANSPVAVDNQAFPSSAARIFTAQAESSLSNETNFGALTTGLLKHTVSGSISTPATAVAGTDYYNPGGTDVALADGGTGASLVDPNADRIFFWDDSAGSTAFLSLGNGLTITTTSIAADSASETVDGIVEIATIAEIETGTDTARVVAVDQLAGSNFGERCIAYQVSDPNGSALTTGNSKVGVHIPSSMTGMNLISADAAVSTVSSSGAVTVMIRRSRRSTSTTRTDADMLSTAITIDVSEFESSDATGEAVNGSNDDIQTGDIIYVDVDAAGTGVKGLMVILVFRLP